MIVIYIFYLSEYSFNYFHLLLSNKKKTFITMPINEFIVQIIDFPTSKEF